MMTERRNLVRDGQPPQQDVDDLIFLGQTDALVSQR